MMTHDRNAGIDQRYRDIRAGSAQHHLLINPTCPKASLECWPHIPTGSAAQHKPGAETHGNHHGAVNLHGPIGLDGPTTVLSEQIRRPFQVPPLSIIWKKRPISSEVPQRLPAGMTAS